MNDRQREYERLIAPIEDRMMRAVWRVSRDPHDAEDAFQEALLTLWKRWERIVQHPNPEALILHICVNAAHDVLRRRLRQRKWHQEGIAAHATASAPASAIENIAAAEERGQVLDAIGRLPKVQARAILMHAVEDVPYGDIATALGCREATVRKHVWRARHKLRVWLSHLIPETQKEEPSHA
ncbi:MAG TPA: RNA polymerase sigma factor [Bryobacteraceae bacterium]|nr:RNA polymerase sigma factor [Bryobacteraceae bacterium]